MLPRFGGGGHVGVPAVEPVQVHDDWDRVVSLSDVAGGLV
jgi:hypothetical protein